MWRSELVFRTVGLQSFFTVMSSVDHIITWTCSWSLPILLQNKCEKRRQVSSNVPHERKKKAQKCCFNNSQKEEKMATLCDSRECATFFFPNYWGTCWGVKLMNMWRFEPRFRSVECSFFFSLSFNYELSWWQGTCVLELVNLGAGQNVKREAWFEEAYHM